MRLAHLGVVVPPRCAKSKRGVSGIHAAYLLSKARPKHPQRGVRGHIEHHSRCVLSMGVSQCAYKRNSLESCEALEGRADVPHSKGARHMSHVALSVADRGIRSFQYHKRFPDAPWVYHFCCVSLLKL